MITKKQLSEYIYLAQAIERTKKSIEYLENNPPQKHYGKVYGSSKEFPYLKRSFYVSGYNGPEADKWLRKRQELHMRLEKQLSELEKLRIEIEEFIQNIPDLSTRLIFTYTYIDGMTQEEVAKKLHMEQSTISKRISKYLEIVNV